MRGEGLEVRIVDLHRDQLHVRDVGRQQLQRALEGGIVPLHVSDLQHLARAIARCGDPVTAGERQGQRLLAQHMQARFERGDRKIGMKGIRRRDDHRVETATEQALDVGIDMLKTVTIAQRLAHRGRCIRERDERKARTLLPQIEGMLRLTDQAGTHQANAQSLHNPAPPLGRNGRVKAASLVSSRSCWNPRNLPRVPMGVQSQ